MRKLIGAFDRAGLLVGSVDHQAALDGWKVIDVGKRRVTRTHLVVTPRPVTVPLAIHLDRRLHLDDKAGHLERRRVFVLPEIR